MKRHHEHATCGIAPGNHNIDQHCFGRAWWTNKYGEIVGFYFSPILSHKDREMKGQPDDKSWLTNIELSKHLGKSCMGGFMAITSDLLGVSKQEPYIIYMCVYIYTSKTKFDDSPAGKTGHMHFSAIQLIPGLCQVLSHGGGEGYPTWKYDAKNGGCLWSTNKYGDVVTTQVTS